MRCPSCGANGNGAYCEYCGSQLAPDRADAQTIYAEKVVVNNYYGEEPRRHARYVAGDSRERSSNASAGVADAASPKSRGIALLLCIFFGFLGAHRFYVGRYWLGVVFLLTAGFLGFGWLVDLVLAIFGRLRDRDGRAVSNW